MWRVAVLSLFALGILCGCGGDGNRKEDDVTVKVYKYNESIQCEDEGIPLEVMAVELVNAGIEVLCYESGHDGGDRAALCGIDTGDINVYQIYESDLIEADSLGFSLVASRGQFPGISTWGNCE